MSIQFLTNTFILLNFGIIFFTLVLLVFMALKTKSKSLTLITVTYTLATFFNSNFFFVWRQISYKSVYFTIFEIMIPPLNVLSYILYSVGVYLCYREWRQGRLTPNKMNEFN